MKYIFILIFILTLGTGCKPKVLSGTALKNKLIETMNDFLNKPHKGDESFSVKDVTYYPDSLKKLYICKFHVSMHLPNKDTTGIMTATISNDFSKVDRTP